MVGGVPVLVDADNSIVGKSVIADGVQSRVQRPRPRGPMRLVKQLLPPTIIRFAAVTSAWRTAVVASTSTITPWSRSIR